MTWWQWLIASILGYLVIGAITSSVWAYIEGRGGNNFDAEDLTLTFFLWPFPVFLALPVVVMEKLLKFLHARGATARDRRQAREDEKALRREIAKFARENGLDPKALQINPNFKAAFVSTRKEAA